MLLFCLCRARFIFCLRGLVASLSGHGLAFVATCHLPSLCATPLPPPYYICSVTLYHCTKGFHCTPILLCYLTVHCYHFAYLFLARFCHTDYVACRRTCIPSALCCVFYLPKSVPAAATVPGWLCSLVSFSSVLVPFLTELPAINGKCAFGVGAVPPKPGGVPWFFSCWVLLPPCYYLTCTCLCLLRFCSGRGTGLGCLLFFVA